MSGVDLERVMLVTGGSRQLSVNERGAFYFLAFECLVERGSARENLSWGRHPRVGYNSLLMEHVSAILPIVYGKRDQSTEQYGRRRD